MALNYGHVLPLVAKYLINREDEVIQWFQDEHHWFKDKLKDEKIILVFVCLSAMRLSLLRPRF